MFCIVDIETTGGSPEQGHKITDICILIHDGLTVVDKFSTLINPERYIPESITRLTGITNEMVEHAPKFYEVAKQIIEITEGKIFVAHNVSFDYNFIRGEYKSLGYNFSREKLCTVKLSRKLLPRRVSYSLGRLCESLGIAIENRHRAEGDAVATAKLFDLLLAKKSEHPTYRRQDIHQLNTTRLDNIKKYILQKLPEETGVYYFLNNKKEILYIGKSNNARDRAIAHFNTDRSKMKRLLQELHDVDFVPTGSELVALLLEQEEIKTHRPPYNRSRKVEALDHLLDTWLSPEGIISFGQVTAAEAREPLAGFPAYISARDTLRRWIDEHHLCLAYCGLSEPGKPCFHYQVKSCYGVCCGEESVEDYNRRAAKILREYRFDPADFILLDRGRHVEEQSVVVVRNGHYAGFGFIDQSVAVSGPAELMEHIRPAPPHPDADSIIRSWMRKHRYRMMPLPVERESE